MAAKNMAVLFSSGQGKATKNNTPLFFSGQMPKKINVLPKITYFGRQYSYFLAASDC
jgi:hypothetical protein